MPKKIFRSSVIAAIWIGFLSTLAESAPKTLLIEKSTDVDCGPCPGASVYVDSLQAIHGDRIIAVDWHYDDAMSSETIYSEFMSYWKKGFPNLNLDRTKGMGLVDFDPSATTRWASLKDTVQIRLASTAPLSIQVEHTWDKTTRKYQGKVKIHFESDVNASDLRVGLMLVQDSVIGPLDGAVSGGTATGPAKRYMQKNYYADSMWVNANWVQGVLQAGATKSRNPPLALDPIHTKLNTKHYPYFGYVHRNVFRASLLGNTWGQSGIIPANPKSGSKYELNFASTLPNSFEGYKGQTTKGFDPLAGSIAVPEHMYLVAFVSSEGEKGILNSVKIPLSTPQIAPIHPQKNSQLLIHNQTLQLPSAGTLKIFNSQGQLIHRAFSSKATDYSLANLSIGIYQIVFVSGDGQSYASHWISQ